MPDEMWPSDTRPMSWFGRSARWLFPAIFLVYVLQTATGVNRYSSDAVAVIGYVGIGVFCVSYLLMLTTLGGSIERRFRTCLAVMIVVCVIELVIAHQYAESMFVFIGVPLIARRGHRAVPVIGGLIALAFVLPAMVPSWHHGIDTDNGFSVGLTLAAMFAFFTVIRSNRELLAARAENDRLAAENERNRIARDLHDLLGHSLTAITVKAGLARRLAAVDPTRAAVEIGEVETLTRQALREVRAAVAGFRDVSLSGELATSGELLQAVGVELVLPDDVDIVRPELRGLFGWVVREGITNVVRHANARHCTITVTATSIDIADDGTAAAPAGNGSGLNGLRERVGELSGRLLAGPTATGWSLSVEIEPSSTASAEMPRRIRR